MLLSSTHHHINTYQYCKVLIIHFYTLGRCSVITGISGDADSLNMSPLMHYFLMWENKTATAVNINLWSMQQQQFDPKLKREILISVCCLSKCVWRSVHVLRATDGDVRTQAFSLFLLFFFVFILLLMISCILLWRGQPNVYFNQRFNKCKFHFSNQIRLLCVFQTFYKGERARWIVLTISKYVCV